jgi:host factor-I protein
MTHVPDSLSSRRTVSERALADPFGDRTAAAGLKNGEPSVQDLFLNTARRDRTAVTVHLMTGVSFDARIKGFDKYAVVVDVSGTEHLVFKHAIAFIESARAAANGFTASHS